MNVLFICPNSPRESIGGVERYISNLIQYYKDRSDGGIFLLFPTVGENRIEKEGNVTIYYESHFFIPRASERNQKHIAKNAREFSTQIGSIITEEKIDIICAENLMFGPPAIYSLLLNMVAAIHKVPLILRLHSFATSELQVELINQLMWSRVSCVSLSVSGDCFHKGTDVDILATHYLGVNTREFNDSKVLVHTLKHEMGIPEDSKIILTATRIVRGPNNILEEKGVINLIRAFSKIYTRYPHLYLLIAVGISTAKLKNEFDQAYEMLLGYIKLHGIEKQTIVKTFALEEMPKVYKESDVFVLASKNETFGQVFIEAMSSGTPVIGTKVGGIPEIISDSYNGFLVRPDDASVLAQKIEILLNDDEQRARFVSAGIKTVQSTFTAERQFANFHSMLEATVAQVKSE